MKGSTPSLSEFRPDVPYQAEVLRDIQTFDYSMGVHEMLLSGSLGSAKSILMAHASLVHLMTYPNARCLIGRLSMPDLRDTIYTKILEHLEGTVKADGSIIKEGKDFGFTDQSCHIWFANGSEYIARSWRDKKFKKLGSLELSIAIVEELAENDANYWDAITFIRMRVGRLPHIPVNWIMYASNPDSPSHPAYEYFELGRLSQGLEPLSPTKHVYFSKTSDNPFLPEWYINQLEQDLDPKMARRMVHGEWIEITTDIIYYAYGSHNYVDTDYHIDHFEPIYLCFDFNIGVGKPMSMCFSQYKNGVFHFFDECIVEGADTEDIMEEIAGKGYLELPNEFIVHGDATGGARTTKSKKTDYDIIRKFLSNYRTKTSERVDFRIDVPKANPAVRDRHNHVNAYCKNSLGKTRLFVYKNCKILNKGFRLTALKTGGSYIEDDSKPYQHVTTAAGYHIVRVHKSNRDRPTVRQPRIR